MILYQKIITAVSLLISIHTTAQQDGYWDKDRATNKQFVVSARQKYVVESDDFPTGTTELLYRITLLNENQELSSSLVSLLKSIPDPTGISQGSAGAVFLVSKVAGTDKCTYAVFNSDALAKNYQDSGSIAKACLVQSTPINKDAKLLSLNKTICLKQDTKKLWFGFESKNWLFNQKVVLEIVPWIDNKLARGWSVLNKKTTLQQLKTISFDIQPISKDLWLIAILSKIQKEFTFAEFNTLDNIEKIKITNDFNNQVLNQLSANDPIFKIFRNDANQYFKQKNVEQAINLLENGILSHNQSHANDYNQLGYYYLYTKQYQKALQNCLKAEKLDDANLAVKLNLAHSYLLLNNFGQAKAIYKKYQNQNINASLSWNSKLQQDFKDLEKAGINSADFERILNKLDN